ncbi:MAG TPA: MarR family transcriptional regulator [Mycobacteriales bacterium]|nr:MarR family transcriptional regulator [Mycobacteriales bacterium]
MATQLPRPLDEREMSAWHALIRSHNRVMRRLEAELESEQRLSLPAYEVLAHLSEAPDQRLRMSELAVHAVLSPSGLTRLVDKLAREGLVSRARCDADARVIYAVLTPEGLARLEAAYPVHLRGVREHFLDHLSEQQCEAIADALGELSGVGPADCAAAAEVEAVAAADCDAAEVLRDAAGAQFVEAP